MQAFWHSTSHVLGEALEACFGVHLTIGPAIEEGFYYDSFMHGRSLSDAEKPQLESKIKQVSETLALLQHMPYEILRIGPAKLSRELMLV